MVLFLCHRKFPAMNSLVSMLFLVISVLFLNESSCQNKNHGEANGLLPTRAGTTWVYRDSVFEDGKLTSVKMDTIRVTENFQYENLTAFRLSDEREFMVMGDTLFQLVRQRGGQKFPTPFFYPSENESTFSYAFGGDVMMQRTVKRLGECPNSEWSKFPCYIASSGCRGDLIFIRGAGIYRETFSDCSSPQRYFSSRTLVSASLSK
jgi:hypothetical protein